MIVATQAAADEGTPRNYLDNSDYEQLRRLIVERGLLKKQPLYYSLKIPFTLGMLAVSLTVLVTIDTLWIQLINAAFLGVAFTQIGMVAHDAGHRQIFSNNRWNEVVLLVVSLMIGLDRSWWQNKHNNHHSNPNDIDNDLDVNLPLLAFTEEQAQSKRGFYRFVVKYQAFFMHPLTMLEGFSLRMDGLQYLIKGHNVKYKVIEPLAITGHVVAYLALIFTLLDPWHGVLFILVNQAVTGFYMASVFAPNHKGMLILEKDSRYNYLRQQVLTARNLKTNIFTDFYYGGLNHQIEHHLFPSMPRNKLGEAQKIIKPFCEANSIPYHETGVIQAQREILGFLHEVSAPLRARRPAALVPSGGED